jgi:hypothetical protein
MKRNYPLSRIAFVLAVGFLLPDNGLAAGVSCLNTSSGPNFTLNGGYWQSSTAFGPASLTITPRRDNEWTGLFTVQGNTYSVTGEIDANGNLEFSSGRTGVRGTGTLQDLTRGGALLTGTYRLSSREQGQIVLLQNFSQPPDPPDIAGSWLGTFTNILCLLTGTDELTIQQDRTPNGTPGTGFTGQETLDTIIYDFVGTIDGSGNFVRIGVSDQGFIIGGGKLESGQLSLITVQNSSQGGSVGGVNPSWTIQGIAERL